MSVILQSGSIIVLDKDQVLYKERQEDLKFYLIIFGCLELLTRKETPQSVDSPLVQVNENISSVG